ncbi:uncharacterized protein LOC129359371 [Poeciliopsis prolifica]|uniref:uncharacterized protein LOC129359371 n=1 Tax=Poeciliopsis prolifica TaxID=188132 RepID=UPI00241337EF|nr:uncharacterized protein LOC129359371 [Poeciliopsis prolifica]
MFPLLPCLSLFSSVSGLSESILQAMRRSRRLLFVLSPDLLAEKSFSLLECRLGLYLQRGQRASILAVVCRSVTKLPCEEAVQLRRAAICTATWRGRRSEPRRSRFWLRLRLALPVRPLALGRRLIDSTSSHSDLAALALQRAQRIRNQNRRDRAGRSRTGRRASANHRKTPSRGRGDVRREEGLQHSRRCSGCAGFMGQVEDRRAEIRGETQIQLRNGTDAVSETDSIIPDPAHTAHSHAPSPNHAHEIYDPASSDLALSGCQQEVDTSRTSEENQAGEKGEELMFEMAPTAPPTENPA